MQRLIYPTMIKIIRITQSWSSKPILDEQAGRHDVGGGAARLGLQAAGRVRPAGGGEEEGGQQHRLDRQTLPAQQGAPHGGGGGRGPQSVPVPLPGQQSRLRH